MMEGRLTAESCLPYLIKLQVHCIYGTSTLGAETSTSFLGLQLNLAAAYTGNVKDFIGDRL